MRPLEVPTDAEACGCGDVDGRSDAAGCGSEQLMRLGARLMARQVDVASTLRLRESLQRNLQGLGGGAVNRTTWQRELERLLQNLLESASRSQQHALTSPAQVVAAIRRCRARFPGTTSAGS